MTAYTITSTTPTVYQEKDNQIVNGVLVRFNMVAYDESHEVRVPKMDVATVKKAIEKMVADRDALAELNVPAE